MDKETRIKESRQRRKMDEACAALAQCQSEFKQDCDALDALLAGPLPAPGRLAQAQHAIRASGMRNIGLTTAYLAAVNDLFQGLLSPEEGDRP